MNALRLAIDELGILLRDLYLATKGTDLNKTQNFTVTCYGQDPEDLNPYVYALELLKKDKVIEKYRKYSSGEEDRDIDFEDFTENAVLSFNKYICKFKPKTLIKYAIENSKIPKYTLTIDKRRRLVLNDKYIMVTLQSNSSNYYFYDYAIKHSNQIIKMEEVRKTAGQIHKRFHTILDQTIKNSELRRVFFQKKKKNQTYFRNYIKNEDLVDEEIDEKDIYRFLKKVKTVTNSHIL
jgi:hypothetical protein